jgi:Cu+-exporting ATPase
LLEAMQLEIPPELEERARRLEAEANTVVFFGWEGQARGFLVFGDRLRPGVREMVGQLRSRKIEAWLVSGDAAATTRAVSEQAGIPLWRGQALPSDKVELIRTLQREKGPGVGMVGDGINDAAALAQADVGFAAGNASDLARETSDLTFLSADPLRIPEALDLSALAARTIKQNLFFSFFYNALGIPLAISGLINPPLAVLAMFASSLTVIGNALRISKKKAGPNDPALLVTRQARRSDS